MKKKKNSPLPIQSLTIKETLYICRLCKLYGMNSSTIPSSKNGGFTSVRVKTLDKFDKELVNNIKREFKKNYQITLSFEEDKVENGVIGYFLKRIKL